MNFAGHVPPSPGNYFSECVNFVIPIVFFFFSCVSKYVRYVELSLRFQDTILGHLFGVSFPFHILASVELNFICEAHECRSCRLSSPMVVSGLNVVQFFFLEAQDLRIFPNEEEKEFNDKDLLESLLEDFGTLPKKPKESDMDDYAVVNVSPSVVPNPYLPSFRIYSYNITGEKAGARKKGKRRHGHRRGSDGNNKTCKSVEYGDTWRCHLNRPWHSDGESPSRSNRRLTPLGYAQVWKLLFSEKKRE